MKKKVFNATNFNSLRRKVSNSLGEEGQKLCDALLDIIDELENADVEYSAEEVEQIIADKLKEISQNLSAEVEEKVANAIAKKFATMQNSINRELPISVKNQVCGAILKARNKNEIENSVMGVLKQNGITGYTFNEVIDFAVVENWGDYNPLYKQLKQTKFTRMFYNTDELTTAKNILAKGWGDPKEAEKVIQQLAVTPKEIKTQYVYKRQQIAFADLDEIEQAGEQSQFLQWITEELVRQRINTIILAILLGDTVNDPADQVKSFETIGTKTKSDAFTTVARSEGEMTVEEVRAICDTVKDPYGYGKVLVLSTSALTALSRFVYAEGGTVSFRTKEEMAQQFGVKEVITLDILEGSETVNAICLIPQEYWVKEKKVRIQNYPTYEKNSINYQNESNVGGMIHGLNSTAVLLKAE